MTEAFHKINCLGLKCPLPVLRLERASQAHHQRIHLVADDPVSIVDIPLWVYQQGAQYTHQKHEDGYYEFFVILKTPQNQ